MIACRAGVGFCLRHMQEEKEDIMIVTLSLWQPAANSCYFTENSEKWQAEMNMKLELQLHIHKI